jgi:hypothetical protein
MRQSFQWWGPPVAGAAELLSLGESLGQAGIPYAEEALGGAFPKMPMAVRAEMAPKAIQAMLGQGKATLTAYGEKTTPEIWALIRRLGVTEPEIQQALSKLMQEGILRRVTGAVPVNIEQIARVGQALRHLSEVGHVGLRGTWPEVSAFAKYLSTLLHQ